MANTLKFGNGQWATGNGTALAYNDENSNFKPLPFDFTRASSGTVVNQSGLIETVASGIPRIDFQGNTEGALLLEPSRTNSIAYSNDLNASGWNTFSTDGGTVTRTSNYGISPSGKQDSTRVVFTTQFVSLYYSFSGISGDASATMYVKGVAGKVMAFGFGSDVSFGQEFTLNGQWQRIEFNATSTNTTLNINAWGSTRDASDIEVYGVQLEAGSYATSYIPTSGSAVTRTSEFTVAPQVNPLSLENDFCVLWEGKVLEDDIMLYGSGTNAWYVNYTTSSGRIILDELSGRKVQAFLGSGSPVNVKTKILIRRENGVHNVFANGIKLTNTQSVNSTATLSLESVGWGFSSAFYKGLKINNFQIFNTALSDAECKKLTTI